MIKNWKKFNEGSNEEEFPDRRTEYGSYINPEGEEYFDDDDDDDVLKPNGVDNMVEGTNGLVMIFSPLEYDMIEDWNSDEKIQKWIKDKRVFLQEVRYDEWAIWGVEGDNTVKNYVRKKFSW